MTKVIAEEIHDSLISDINNKALKRCYVNITSVNRKLIKFDKPASKYTIDPAQVINKVKLVMN